MQCITAMHLCFPPQFPLFSKCRLSWNYISWYISLALNEKSSISISSQEDKEKQPDHFNTCGKTKTESRKALDCYPSHFSQRLSAQELPIDKTSDWSNLFVICRMKPASNEGWDWTLWPAFPDSCERLQGSSLLYKFCEIS